MLQAQQGQFFKEAFAEAKRGWMKGGDSLVYRGELGGMELEKGVEAVEEGAGSGIDVHEDGPEAGWLSVQEPKAAEESR